ncbi:MAG TPA: sugar phosphate nucleotidyltransferase [Bryobacteraceae bacterium]|nr:sugar phosphate nucleotidyltransferase [Bryobacteraceae bacterium]
MQCVILAGGLATRMRPLTESCPKTLLPVCGRPFAHHQLHWLAAQGITEVVYSIGHHGGMIRRYWEQTPCPIPCVRYVDEGERLRGTGGALRLASEAGALNESFFVLYGDSFLPVAFGPVWNAFRSSGMPALMTVLRNEGRWDHSNAIYQDGRVLLYDKRGHLAMHYIDYGLSALRREVLEGIQDEVFDLATLFHQLSLRDQLAGFEVDQRFYEIGSPEGLRDFENYLQAQSCEPVVIRN